MNSGFRHSYGLVETCFLSLVDAFSRTSLTSHVLWDTAEIAAQASIFLMCRVGSVLNYCRFEVIPFIVRGQHNPGS